MNFHFPHSSLVLAALALTPSINLCAQEPVERLTPRGTRFELGQRLRAMERSLEADTTQAQIDRVLEPLSGAVQSYFRGDVAAVGRTLVQCQTRLTKSREPTATEYALGALCVAPGTRLLDTNARQLGIAMIALFDTEREADAADGTVRFVLRAEYGGSGAGAAVPIGNAMPLDLEGLPTSWQVALPDLEEGDYSLTAHITLEGQDTAFVTEPLALSLADNLDARIARLDTAAEAISRDERGSTAETLRHTLRLLSRVRESGGDETNHPGLRMIQQGEAMVAALGAEQSWFGTSATGDLRVRLNTEHGLVIARLWVPPDVKSTKRQPLVIALHGAGGSENMFFDGYGDGLGPKLAQERGWIFLSPRTNTRPDALAAVVEELARHYPIDTERVYLLGHSMGAGATAANFQAQPETYRAISLIGGGGAVRDRQALASVPILVAIGDKDFLRRGAMDFARRVQQNDAHQLTVREYSNVEHMAIVQLALRDVFAFFEAH